MSRGEHPLGVDEGATAEGSHIDVHADVVRELALLGQLPVPNLEGVLAIIPQCCDGVRENKPQ